MIKNTGQKFDIIYCILENTTKITVERKLELISIVASLPISNTDETQTEREKQ
jgi:hypothetical protein